MREILFRGKRKDNGRWIFGDLIHRQVWMSEIMIIRTGDNGFDVYTEYEVIPQTVGQYTGLTDKNGKKIFEGDILKIYRHSNSAGKYYDPSLEAPYNVVVKYDLCAWTWETLTKDRRYIHFPEAWCHYICEVIGNIHDNPEPIESEVEE